MKNRNLIFITACLSFMILLGCMRPKYVIPNRNIDNYIEKNDSMNTAKSEVAPFQRPNVNNCAQAYTREFSAVVNQIDKNDGVLPSYRFVEMWNNSSIKDNQKVYEYLTSRVEAAYFLTDNEGYVAFSHAPDSSFSSFMSLGFNGTVGGTDIFHFETKDGKPIFTALDKNINSEFWDSHPWVGVDSVCNLVMIWASDRDNPYSVTKDLEGRPLAYGNSDLFYAFKIGGKWSAPVKFDTTNGLNTNRYNEVSPFVACLNSAPKLLFSSNRTGDYDIYSVNLKVDFKNQVIIANGSPEALPKGDETDQKNFYINTRSNEMFPMVAIPYMSKNSEKMLYVSSDRNESPISKFGSKDTLIKSKGKFDLYKFPFGLDCSEPPKPIILPKMVTLNVDLVDALNKSDEIRTPVIKLFEVNSGKEVIRKGKAHESFELELNKDYLVFGGSERNSNNCDEVGDSVLMYYQAKLVTKLEPKIEPRTVKIEYDSLVNAELKTVYDTSYVKEYYTVSQQNSTLFNNSESKEVVKAEDKTITQTKSESVKDVKIKACTMACDTTGLNLKGVEALAPNEPLKQLMEVTKMQITKREWYEGGKMIKKTRSDIAYDTIISYDTTMIPAIGPSGKSELTHLSKISTHFSERDTLINDIVELYPQYYVKPPCSCEFISIEHPYNKNVPYYQTAFWKVNTTDGLTQHLEDFQEGNYLERAAYIELHPKNRKYGAGKDARDDRKKDYRKYAEIVDLSLRAMKDEITKRFIPAMEALDTIAEGNKVLIKLEAYSDVRDAGSCEYIGSTVEYTAGSVNTNKNISLHDIKISSGASLNADNDNLSKLRVYFGFMELMKRLRWDDRFMHYLNKGLVYYPTQEFKNEEERQKALEKAKIIIIMEGKKADPQVKSNETDYDSIRRLNLHIDLIRMENEKVVISPCCNPKLPTVPVSTKKK